MLDFLYETGWGAFSVMLLLQIPFIIFFFYLIYQKAIVNPRPSDTDAKTFSNVERSWMTVVILLFLAINIASIKYMPTVRASQAAASDIDFQEVAVEGFSWYFEMSNRELEIGRPVRFSAKSGDTMHGFAVYHPEGRLLFTLMLLPGLEKPATLVHTFTEPGIYPIRCLEYCGASHHLMRDELVVVQSTD